VREHADGITPQEEGMSLDEHSTPEPDDVHGARAWPRRATGIVIVSFACLD
jgi:hypothetical protein